MTGKITIRKETHEISILTSPAVSEKRFCDRCFIEVRWLMPDEAVVLARISSREIFRLVETCELHFTENRDGFLIVCAESLAALMKK